MNTISVSYYVARAQRRADGSFPLKVRVTYLRKSRYLATNKVAYPSDLTRSGKLKNGGLVDGMNGLIREVREAIGDLRDPVDVDAVMAHIKRKREGPFRLDLFAFADGWMDARQITEGTRNGYRAALSAFRRWLGCDTLDVNEVTRRMVTEFAEWLDGSRKFRYDRRTGEVVEGMRERQGGGQSYRMVGKLATIYNAARERYNDDDAVLIPRQPFAVRVEKPLSSGQKNLGLETMQRIVDARPRNQGERLALASFVVSFALMGANLADLYDAPAFAGEVWTYRRRKTASRRSDGAEMRVDVPGCIRPFLDTLGAGTPSPWWLPALHSVSADKDRVTAYLNRHLRAWATAEGLPPFTMYAARKTFASLARKAGVEKATIDECLAHAGDMRMADLYIEKDWRIINDGARMALSLIRWEKRP
jgi:hypothetical protein